jgi:hypothetical protein
MMLRLGLAAVLVFSLQRSVAAQDVPLSQFLSNFITSAAVLNPGPDINQDHSRVARGNVVLASRTGTANQAYAIVSSKLLVGEHLIFYGAVLAPLQRHGLAAGIGAVAGLGSGL